MSVLSRIRKKFRVLRGAERPASPQRAGPPPTPRWEPEPEELPESPRGAEPAAAFVERWVSENRVVLFMKGDPTAPQCGFSASAVAILDSCDVSYEYFDVLLDPEVREGVKRFGSWPTIPQCYVQGELLGGSDILMQLYESGELQQKLGDP